MTNEERIQRQITQAAVFALSARTIARNARGRRFKD